MSYPTPSREVIERVAALEGVAPTDLTAPNYDVLHDVIDPDALDALCRPSERTAVSIEVAFGFNGYRVIVANDGSISVRDDPSAERNR